MRFHVWFGLWIHSLFRLLTVNARRSRKHKTLARRKKEFERGLARRLAAERYRVTKTRRHRRSRHTAQNVRFTRALLRFLVVTLGILLLPVGLIDWGRKNQAERAQERLGEDTSILTPKTVAATSVKASEKPPVKEAESLSFDIPRFAPTYTKAPAVEPTSLPEKAEEATPRSTPKSPKDQYIRKRITLPLAGEMLPRLSVGAYLALVRESEASQGKDIVKLMLDGICVGHIPEKDALPYLACLRLERKVYAVITAISDTPTLTYEIETWFAAE